MWPFNTAKAADDILDKDKGLLKQAGEWIGNQQFTAEEQSEARREVMKAGAQFVSSTLGESTERSKTRREVAIRWITVQLGLVLLVAVVAPFNMELAKFYFELATSELMLWGTIGVLTFFFGPYAIGTHLGKLGGLFNKGKTKDD